MYVILERVLMIRKQAQRHEKNRLDVYMLMLNSTYMYMKNLKHVKSNKIL